MFLKSFLATKFCIDEKDEERTRARLSRDGEGRAFHPTPPPTPSRHNEVRELVGGGSVGVGVGGGGRCAHFVEMAGGGGWGGVECAPFTVTAEPRSLSLFIFFVDVKVHNHLGCNIYRKASFLMACGARKNE